jgi:hypothetical protein
MANNYKANHKWYREYLGGRLNRMIVLPMLTVRMPAKSTQSGEDAKGKEPHHKTCLQK